MSFALLSFTKECEYLTNEDLKNNEIIKKCTQNFTLNSYFNILKVMGVKKNVFIH